ncbi:MAG: hypothetical protein HZB53_01405 [Chloroflexi bacterium]|nr:hypothetical protein [Chloroflexota bacterium]
MQPVLNFVSGIAIWLYIVSAIIFLVAVRFWWGARRDVRNTIYGLEKESATDRAWGAITFALLSLVIGGAVYYADANADHLPPVAPQRSPTPNLALFITPTATAPVPTATAAPPTPTPLRGPVASPTPKLTLTNTPSAATNTPPPAACPNPSARIISPGADAHLFGPVTVRGSATIPEFQYYKIEYGVGENPPGWTVIGDLRRQPVSDGALVTFNADGFAPGVYGLRLTVVDQRGNFPVTPCVVRVFFGQ